MNNDEPSYIPEVTMLAPERPGCAVSLKAVLLLIKLGVMLVALILKLVDTSSCARQPEPEAIDAAHVITQPAVEEAFGQRFSNFSDQQASEQQTLALQSFEQYFAAYAPEDASFVLISLLLNDSVGSYEEENRKSGDEVLDAQGIGDDAEFILNEQSQSLIVQCGQYLIVLNCVTEDGDKAVDRKAELLALGKLCCVNLNRLLDK
jgi:hypothetical protein